jgi:ferritin-like metal-binding protein YciE
MKAKASIRSERDSQPAHDRAHELMITGLRNAHAMEQQAIEFLERNVERLDDYPDLRALLAEHLEESRRQQSAVANMLQEFDADSSTLKDMVMGMATNVQSLAHSMADDEVLKNSFAGYAFEHFEIAAYQSLAIMAREAGALRVERLAMQIMSEEQDMARKLKALLPNTVSRYITLSARSDEDLTP